MRLWLFEWKGAILNLYDTPLTVVIRSTSYTSAIRVFEKEYPGQSADDYAITRLQMTGKSGVICCDMREG